MKTIWEYPIQTEGYTPIEMPKDAIPRFVAGQGMELTLWVEVNPDAPREVRYFRVFGTGKYIGLDVGLVYIGSAIVASYVGNFVWHVYEDVS